MSASPPRPPRRGYARTGWPSSSSLLVPAFDTKVAGDIDEPAEAEHGVRQHATKIVSGLLRLALQQPVDRREEVVDVVEDVGEPRAHELRDDRDITFGDRFDDVRVEDVVDLVERAIHRLERIDLRRHCRTTRKKDGGSGRDRKAQCGGHLPAPAAALSNRNCPISFSSTTADWVLPILAPSPSIFGSPPTSRPT